jgi:hypothetical protein
MAVHRDLPVRRAFGDVVDVVDGRIHHHGCWVVLLCTALEIWKLRRSTRQPSVNGRFYARYLIGHLSVSVRATRDGTELVRVTDCSVDLGYLGATF